MADLIIKLRGGTGNQLFQAATAFSLAEIYKKNCKFSIKGIGENKYKRKLEIFPVLNHLGIKERKLFNKEKIIYLDQYDMDHPIFFSKSSPIAKLEKDILLQGYFSSYRLINKKVLQKIKKYIKGLNSIEKFKDLEFMVLHIRELHGTGSTNINCSIDNLNLTYYSKALSFIKKDKATSKIKRAIVFSDMWQNPQKSILLPQIKLLLKDLDIKYINGDKYIKNTMDILCLFANSKVCLISNSTLSWWGGYLSDGKVFSPVMSLWEPDLKIPDNWKQIYANELIPKTHHNKFIFNTHIIFPDNRSLNKYNLKRINIINFIRFYIQKIFTIKAYKKFINWIKSKGILFENTNNTFS